MGSWLPRSTAGGPAPEKCAKNARRPTNPSLSGTSIRFLPDGEIFTDIVYDFDVLTAHFKEIAYLNKGLEVHFTSYWHEEEREGDIKRSYYFDGGLASLVRSINSHRKVLQEKPFYMQKAADDTIVEAAIQYNDGYNEHVLSFANCIPTEEGRHPPHGLQDSPYEGDQRLRAQAEAPQGRPGEPGGRRCPGGPHRRDQPEADGPQFEGQTKTKLGNAEVKSIVETLVGEALTQYLEEHLTEGKRIIENCMTAQKAREAAKKARELVIRKNALDGSSLPGKLADCSERNPELSEIYVVEASPPEAPQRWGGTAVSRPSCP